MLSAGMTYDDFINKTKEIVENLSDQGLVTSTLSELSEEFKTLRESNDQLITVNATLTDENKSLKKYNMDLFMKVGSENNENDTSFNNQSDAKETEKLNFEDLFNEKGELK